MSELLLRTGNASHGGWKNINVMLSMEQMADTFSIDVTEKWKGQIERRSIRKGESCTVDIDGERVITGFIGDVNPNYDAQTHTISIAGDSRTIDLVDCSADPFQWQGLTLAQGAQQLAAPYGITVIDEVGDTTPFTTLKANAGDSIGDVLMQAAHIRACLLMVTPEGNLRITRAATGAPQYSIELGKNAVQCSGNNSARDQFSVYKLLEQQQGSDNLDPEDAAAVVAEAIDNTVSRFRQLIISGEYPMTPEQAKARIENERNVRWGRAQRATYQVRGWRYNGLLWQPNRMVSVRDAYQGIADNRIISSVNLMLDESGEYARITVTPRETFDLVPQPEPEASGSGELQ